MADDERQETFGDLSDVINEHVGAVIDHLLAILQAVAIRGPSLADAANDEPAAAGAGAGARPDDESVRLLVSHAAALENPRRIARLYRAAADRLDPPSA